MAKPRVKVPKKVEKGVPFEVKSLVSHKMESGQRKDKEGKPIPRMIINKFVATYNGEESRVEFSLKNKDEPFNAGGVTKRSGWHICAWCREHDA